MSPRRLRALRRQSSAAAVASGVGLRHQLLRGLSRPKSGARILPSPWPPRGHGAKAEEVAAVHLHRFFAHSPSCIVDLFASTSGVIGRRNASSWRNCAIEAHRLRAVIREITSEVIPLPGGFLKPEGGELLYFFEEGLLWSAGAMT